MSVLKGKHVLAIDDSRATRNFLSNLIKPACAAFEAAQTAREGLRKCRHRHFDLILLDMQLPDIDGAAVLDEIRLTNDASAIVILTGEGGTRTATDAVRRGADGYVEKQHLSLSTDHEEFFYALRQALEHRAGLLARKQLDRVRSDFYAMVTHDLRNPAAAVDRVVKVLRERVHGPLTPEQQRLVDIAADASTELLRLINNYLDYSRIESNALTLNRASVSLGGVLRGVEGWARVEAGERGHAFLLELPEEDIQADVDADWLKQSVTNLVANAVKYTDPGGRIVVRLLREDHTALICVEDNGRGIPADALEKLFVRYRRGEESTEPGTGLGLAVVKQVVEAHGGSVWAESPGQAGGGSRFWIRLPMLGTAGAGRGKG